MNAGSLFIELGLSGTDKLFKGLQTANSSLNQIKETGLETARNLHSAFGKFEGQVQTFATFGSTMKHFQESTGLSAIALQKFQKAFIGVGVSADETRESVVGLQSMMSDIQRGRAIPQAMALALRKANIDPTQIKDIYGLVDKLRGVSKSMDTGIGRSIFADLGLSSTFYQGLRRSTGDISKIAPSMGEGAISGSEANLNKINLYKYNLEAKLGSLLAKKEVGQVLDSVYKIILKLVDLLDVIVKLGTKSGVFDLLVKIIDIAGNLIIAIANIVSAGIAESLTDMMSPLAWITGKGFVENMQGVNKFLSTDALKSVNALPSVNVPQKIDQAKQFVINQVNHNHGTPEEIASGIHKKNVKMVEHYKNVKTPQGK
jgi:hypothetical protein